MYTYIVCSLNVIYIKMQTTVKKYLYAACYFNWIINYDGLLKTKNTRIKNNPYKISLLFTQQFGFLPDIPHS